ncbi:alpha/beta-hydrolase [Fistulina hepatica ATCC 64428]|uniref:Carboxylic ester hydrolase n=1 Tax=Fistulina hepatica ATCC 64428 TaxID=1128425 RepID=A0A0D7AMH1_9AGAR|nr:alpha/beta-hydrolase [Fistulina hepatica ATCC 64428]
MLYSALFVPSLAASMVYASSIVNVTIGNATVIGIHNTTLGVETFQGIKYGTAKRFQRIIPPTYNESEVINGTFYGVACPQIPGSNALAVDYGVYGTDEDCTLLDIYRPPNTKSEDRLPVMLWLHGGALTQGAASHYPGYGMVAESIEIRKPIIEISINYRLAVWGFLGGVEASAHNAQNLGLYDQRAALEWVQKYISNFGGDPHAVTIFGQSSGAMSVAYHMLNTTNDLFRAAIMESGSSTSVPCLEPSYYQNVYDGIIDLVGCNTTLDTFECLSTVNETTLSDAATTLYKESTIYSGRPWGVTIDGEIIPDNPAYLTAQGKLLQVPFINGDVLDEGTIFVQPQALNTTSDLLTFVQRDYVARNASFFSNQTSEAQLLELYPDDPALGSPYGTGNVTFWGPEFKRGAAIYGDLHFQAPRRNFLNVAVSQKISAWSYIFDQFITGTDAWEGVFMKFNVSDGPLYELSKQTFAYWASFANNMDPNSDCNPRWEQYTEAKNILNITANGTGTTLIVDDYRQEQMA